MGNRATAGVRLEPHSHCRVRSGGRSRRFRQPMSLSEPKRCPSHRLPSRRLACQHDRKDLCAKAWSHRTTKAGAACKCLRRRRGRRRSLAAAAHSGRRRGDGLLQSIQAALGASELRLSRPKRLIFSKPSHAPATRLVRKSLKRPFRITDLFQVLMHRWRAFQVSRLSLGTR